MDEYNAVMRFQVIFTYDEDYKGYVAEVPELPGCFSQGKTMEEAMENVRDAIQGVLHVMAESGEPYTPTGKMILVGEIAV
jgi:predicted RNase H-like HicB family nuclease